MIGNGSERMEEEREIDIFVTNKCNSNCIMCPMSEGSRRKNTPPGCPFFVYLYKGG